MKMDGMPKAEISPGGAYNPAQEPSDAHSIQHIGVRKFQIAGAIS